jgi:hypothetical protein
LFFPYENCFFVFYFIEEWKAGSTVIPVPQQLVPPRTAVASGGVSSPVNTPDTVSLGEGTVKSTSTSPTSPQPGSRASMSFGGATICSRYMLLNVLMH